MLIKEEEEAPLRFASLQAQTEAIALLDSLVWGDDEGGEWRSLVNKMLCGWPLDVPLGGWPEPGRLRELREPIKKNLQAVLNQLQQLQQAQGSLRPGLEKFTVRDLCQLFLQRSGLLEFKDNATGWLLTLNVHPADPLLWGLPWPLEQIAYPWMKIPLNLCWDQQQPPR